VGILVGGNHQAKSQKWLMRIAVAWEETTDKYMKLMLTNTLISGFGYENLAK
jgi:hypothetical protein